MQTRTSTTISVLAVAILAAQRKMENVTFDSTNPHFKNKYAGLPGVLEEVKAKLNDQGITIMQLPTDPGQPDHLGLITRLQHESGEFIEATAIVPLPKSDPQGFGSAMTYTRRYALLSILGLVGEADDDANAASGGGSKPAGTPRAAPTGGGFFKPGKAASAPSESTEPAKAPEKKKAGLFPVPK